MIMSRKDTRRVIDNASPHTVKKFEVIAGYVTEWKEKLLMTPQCKNLIFIDCMSGSGEYTDIDGKQVFGTPVRAAGLLREAAERYPKKNIYAVFNDIDAEKIAHLKTLVNNGTGNYYVSFHNEDCNKLIRELRQKILGRKDTHYLLVYDPYDAAIDWDAVMPFLNGWGEVIINHMISDSMRAIGSVKRQEAVSKYEATYQKALVELVEWGSDRKKYEECIEGIIRSLHEWKGREYYIASFPFFNSKNSLVYDLIFCTGHIKGFTLFKKTAWQVFGGSSSNKNTHGQERQGTFEFYQKDASE